MKLFEKSEKIRFEHIDQAGIVFYPRFLQMLNGLAEDWFDEALGWPFHEMHPRYGVPTVQLQVQFKKPARLGEIIQKKLWVKKLGSSSAHCGFRFEDQQQHVILEGEVTLVCVSILSETEEINAMPWPEEVKQKMNTFIHS
jgi:4-hydroxybenzoyl-CoA thioesterase